MVSKALVNGGKGAAAATAGTMLLGPTIGAPIAGWAADEFVGGSVPWLPIGVAIGLTTLMPMSGGSSGSSRGTL